MSSHSLATKLSVYYTAIWFASACVNPFLILYYQQMGFSYTEIGIANALFSIIGVFTQPLWGFISDKYLNKRQVLIILGLFCSLIIYGFVIASNLISIIVVLLLLSAFQSAIMPIADAKCYEVIDNHKNIQYGRIRLTGSIGYAVGAVVVGKIIEVYGLKISYIIYSVVTLFSCFVIFWIRDSHFGIQRPKINFQDGLRLFKNIRFSLFLIITAFAYSAIGCNVGYLAILIQKTGGNAGNLGLMWFVIALSAAPALFIGKKLVDRFGDLNLFLIGMIAYALRFFLDSSFDSNQAIIIVQLLESISYTFFLLGTLEYLNKITPAHLKAISMTLYTSACGLGGLIGNVGGGMLLERIDVILLYKVISFISLISAFFVYLLKKVDKRSEIAV